MTTVQILLMGLGAGLGFVIIVFSLLFVIASIEDSSRRKTAAEHAAGKSYLLNFGGGSLGEPKSQAITTFVTVVAGTFQAGPSEISLMQPKVQSFSVASSFSEIEEMKILRTEV